MNQPKIHVGRRAEVRKARWGTRWIARALYGELTVSRRLFATWAEAMAYADRYVNEQFVRGELDW